MCSRRGLDAVAEGAQRDKKRGGVVSSADGPERGCETKGRLAALFQARVVGKPRVAKQLQRDTSITKYIISGQVLLDKACPD